MKISHFEYLVDLHDTLSLSKSAENFFTSHQSIGNAISTLENELNTTLIERTHRGIIFTDIGEKVYGYALNILESRNNILEICKNNALSAHQNLSGNFDIFVIPRFSNNQFFKVFAAVSRNFPKLTLSLKTISWNTFLDVLPIENEFLFLIFIDEDHFNDKKYHQLLDAHELRTEIIKEFPLGVC